MILWQAKFSNVTAGVVTSPLGRIVKAAPALKGFIDQPIVSLERWVNNQGGTLTQVRRLSKSSRQKR